MWLESGMKNENSSWHLGLERVAEASMSLWEEVRGHYQSPRRARRDTRESSTAGEGRLERFQGVMLITMTEKSPKDVTRSKLSGTMQGRGRAMPSPKDTNK